MISVGVNPPHTPVTAGSNGISPATAPNVCKMPGPPAPFVPTPLPNIGKSDDRPGDYTRTVKIEGKAIAVRGSYFMSKGDIASKGTGGGLISAATHGKTEFVAPGSMNVNAEGKNIQLLGDMMTNNGSNPTNSLSKELQAAQAKAEACKAALEEARRIADEERELNKSRPKDERTNKVSVIRMIHTKNMSSGINKGGNIPEVQAKAESFPRNKHNCQCSELNCVSNAIESLTLPTAVGQRAVIVTVDVRSEKDLNQKHGRHKPACSVCQLVLVEYGIHECGPED